ncbi:hypothetical protein Tco_0403609 [Tanacetum coccineum]
MLQKQNILKENNTQQKANTLPNSKDDVNGACDQSYVSTDVHRDDSSRPNNDSGNPKYFKDDIDLIQLRSNLDKIMEEEKRRRGFTLEVDDLDCYDGYEAHIYDLPELLQAFCDHYDIHLKNHARK